MLRTLTIKNIALITSAEIDFATGLNILTGETGAGKSIVIDSLNFVLGARADKTLIRHGQSQALVEVEFDEVNTPVLKMLDEYDIDCTEGLIITRSMSIEGRNVCRVNGVKLPVSGLREIASAIVDIYGQHDNSVLLDSDTHIDIIDSFGGTSIVNAKANYDKVYRRYKKIKSEIKKFSSMADVEIRSQILAKQVAEIKAFGVSVGEEDRLQRLCDTYDNIDEIKRATLTSHSMLYEMDDSAGALISNAIKLLNNIEDYDSSIAGLVERLESASIEIADVSNSIFAINDAFDIDEGDASVNMDRLHRLHELEGKYGNTESDVLAYLDKIERECDELGNAGYELDKLSREIGQVFIDLKEVGLELSKLRLSNSLEFAQLVVHELRELGMPNTTFMVQICSLETDNDIEFSSDKSGFDSVEFLISPNAGEPLKPLNKVISGGEMSRFMLAIKKITAELDGVNVMVFDEIDTGISGKIAQVVANKLYDISVSRQVLAVTHLPQLASMADNHYLIEKTTDNVTTATNVKLLNYDESVDEIAKMIDGEGGSEYARMHAGKIKDNACEYKLKR